MIITSQGFGHFTQGLNNQDFGIENSNLVLVLDGCSSGKFSEIGTRLFAQLFAKKDDFANPEKFENNVKEVFDEIISMMRKHYASDEDFESNFIMENMLFTILACFKTEDKFIVKMFGDGYVVTENIHDKTSYMRFAYGKCPPYFAYKYCSVMPVSVHEFKTLEFDKKHFKAVGVATDGILPIVKGEIKGFDALLSKRNELVLATAINNQRSIFFDDLTIAML